ncbi:DUF2281 domain-containing protein [Thermodesulfobacterium commune]|jgi:hypothetical protein|nr:DUF2281 domain-containing protein [Thermodesulfobacterium commune]HAA83621.1 DUF2281 domain-containing protein [Thermodesulfobacterium commune]
MQSSKLKELIDQLPPDLYQVVEDFIEFLLTKRKKPIKPPTFEWAGALEDLRDSYTSVELQHKILDWRSGKS